MVTFFKHLGIGLMSALTAFTSAFHTTPSTPEPMTATSTVRQEVTTGQKNKDSGKSSRSDQSEMQTLVQIVSPIATSQPAKQTSDFSLFRSLPTDFDKNPPSYIGMKVKIRGTVADFLAAGDRGGSANYIEIIPASVGNVPYFALQIDAKDYQMVAQDLNRYNNIVAYGSISVSKNLNVDQSTTVLVPVLNTARIDICNSYTVCTVNVNPHTIFPLTSANTIPRDQWVSLVRVFQNPNQFTNKQITTFGKVIRLLQSDTTGDTTVFLQDPSDGRGLGFFTISSGFISDNQIKVGTNLVIQGTIMAANSSDATDATADFHSVDTSGYFYVNNGLVNVDYGS